ncbi:hypothetical protein FHS61_000906 [Altererythrobacter atlanticus]|uniref:Uncharacterized protein n=1 Tax=Croceibacterium atlanticum TaxID=1267766 RepID=A0A0F7KW65_9SPHN|nr:hypothetical protein [Croceibacterium atlanticum]AKH43391.1 hypothetical protein WYH_02359 [Croceibacterium atlanticum]MBB5731902.1 hypothetical protein [Croceibacterium atlanticum]
MLEGKPPRIGDHRPLDPEEGENGVLRPLEWSDLVRRLSVARDLRASPGESDCEETEDVDASFDAGSARRIAARQNGKDAINPDASANGKETGGKDLPEENGKDLPKKSARSSPVRGKQ